MVGEEGWMSIWIQVLQAKEPLQNVWIQVSLQMPQIRETNWISRMLQKEVLQTTQHM